MAETQSVQQYETRSHRRAAQTVHFLQPKDFWKRIKKYMNKFIYNQCKLTLDNALLDHDFNIIVRVPRYRVAGNIGDQENIVGRTGIAKCSSKGRECDQSNFKRPYSDRKPLCMYR